MLHLVCLPAFTVLYSSQKHPHQLPPKEGETSAKGIDVHTCITDHFTCFRTKKLELQMRHFSFSHSCRQPKHRTTHDSSQHHLLHGAAGSQHRVGRRWKIPCHHLHRAKTQTSVTDENRAWVWTPKEGGKVRGKRKNLLAFQYKLHVKHCYKNTAVT